MAPHPCQHLNLSDVCELMGVKLHCLYNFFFLCFWASVLDACLSHTTGFRARAGCVSSSAYTISCLSEHLHTVPLSLPHYRAQHTVGAWVTTRKEQMMRTSISWPASALGEHGSRHDTASKLQHTHQGLSEGRDGFLCGWHAPALNTTCFYVKKKCDQSKVDLRGMLVAREM